MFVNRCRQYGAEPDKEVMMLIQRARKVVMPAAVVLIVASSPARGEQQQTTHQSVASVVKVDDLEERPSQYIGKRVRTTAEVEKVLGPRVFTIDEPGWIDLQGETLVQVSSPLAVPVREGTMVTVEGTVKRYDRADLADDWGWLGYDQRTELALERKPVLVADHVFGTNANLAFIIDLNKEMNGPNWPGIGEALTKASAVAAADEKMVGRRVNLDDVAVGDNAGKGFFVKSGDEFFFALPATPQEVSAGERMKLDGFLMQMPSHMRDTLNAPDGTNEDVYLYVARTS